MSNRIKKHPAFTLIELLIVIGIIGIMSVVGIVSLGSGKSKLKLQSAQREVAATIKLAQSYALQGKTQNGATPCGYGFRLDPNDSTDKKKYEIFYNAGPNCDQKNSDPNYRHYRNGNPDPSGIAESHELGNGVKLKAPNIYSGDPNTTELYFTIPHAKMYNNTGNDFTFAPDFEFDLGGVSKSMVIGANAAITEN